MYINIYEYLMKYFFNPRFLDDIILSHIGNTISTYKDYLKLLFVHLYIGNKVTINRTLEVQCNQ